LVFVISAAKPAPVAAEELPNAILYAFAMAAVLTTATEEQLH
jgi:hypothetical protein